MPTLAWVLHNNSSNMSRLIVEGLRELGRDEFEHVTTREDLLGLRPPDLSRVADVSRIGEFPDHDDFVPELASLGFWERLPEADWIVFVVNGGRNHNARRAAELIRRHDLFDRLVYVEEDERGELHPDYRDMFLEARLAVVAHRPRLAQMFRAHPQVVHFGFNGVESRYLRWIPTDTAEKPHSVFYRGRAGARMPHREPFITTLRARDYPAACVMPELPENTELEDLRLQHVSGNRHNVRYYELLAQSKVAVYLNGYNPVGFQWWENAAMKAAQVVQKASPSPWYHGGTYPVDHVDVEDYEPPFREGEHYVTFGSPDEMLEQIDYLLSHDDERERMVQACHELALAHYTSRARAERFLAHLLREP
jgi:glycosyltransferase involved in cell wall biosynthesis